MKTFPTARPKFANKQNLEDGEPLNVTLTYDRGCFMQCAVTVSFGTQPLSGGGNCAIQAKDTREVLSPGETATFSVNAGSVTRESGEVYCYTVSVCGEIG